jgi:uncharacterized membrane protein YgcG
MDSELEINLIDCLGRLDDGEPIDRILARYPDHAASLRPLLETATALADLRRAPRETARIASRRAFLAQAHELRESTARPRFWLPRRMAIAIAALAAFIFMSGAVAASASALPSEPLYGVKRAVEDARLLVADGAEKEQLAASFGQRRRDEIYQLLARRRDTAIAFEGTIEIIQPNGWEISGLYIYLDHATTIAGKPVVGGHARIQGHTEAGRLLADSINIEPSSNSILSPTATATAQPSATAAPSPSPSPSPQPEATRQPIARPTSAPTHMPTAAPRLRSTSAPPTAAPPATAPPTNVPPTNESLTVATPTQESDHGGNEGGDGSSGGGGDTSGGDHGGSDDNSGGGGDNGGGGGDDHGGGGGSGGEDKSGGGDSSGGDQGAGGDSSGGDHGDGGGADTP